MKLKIISLNVFLAVSFALNGNGQTPIPSASPARRLFPSLNTPHIATSPAAATRSSPGALKPAANSMVPNATGSGGIKPIVISGKAPSAGDLKNLQKSQIKSLTPAEKQQVLSGKIPAGSFTLSMEHMRNTKGIEASIVIDQAAIASPLVSIINGTNTMPEAKLYLFLTPTVAGQTFLVDVCAYNDLGDNNLKGFTVNGQPVPATSITPGHLLFVLTSTTTEQITCDIATNHSWIFDHCEVTQIK